MKWNTNKNLRLRQRCISHDLE